MSPRKPTFNVTARGLTLDEDHLSNSPGRSFAIYGLLFTDRLRRRLPLHVRARGRQLMLVVGLWNVQHDDRRRGARRGHAERKQPDRHPRLHISRQGTLSIGDQRTSASPSATSRRAACRSPPPASSTPWRSRPASRPAGWPSIRWASSSREETLPLTSSFTPRGANDQTIYGFEFSAMEPDESTTRARRPHVRRFGRATAFWRHAANTKNILRFRPVHLVGADRTDPRDPTSSSAKGEEGSSHWKDRRNVVLLAQAVRRRRQEGRRSQRSARQ